MPAVLRVIMAITRITDSAKQNPVSRRITEVIAKFGVSDGHSAGRTANRLAIRRYVSSCIFKTVCCFDTFSVCCADAAFVANAVRPPAERLSSIEDFRSNLVQMHIGTRSPKATREKSHTGCRLIFLFFYLRFVCAPV